MLPYRRVAHPRETYRFSTTQTLSDYPLLIGEILRRPELRAIQQAKRRSFLFDLARVLGLRVRRTVGSRKKSLLTEVTWQHSLTQEVSSERPESEKAA